MIGVSVLLPTELRVAANPGGDRSAVSGVLGTATGRGAGAGGAGLRAARRWRGALTSIRGRVVALRSSGGETARGDVFAGVVEEVGCAEAIGQSAVVPNATARNIFDAQLLPN
jgi:hypothetical protein